MAVQRESFGGGGPVFITTVAVEGRFIALSAINEAMTIQEIRLRPKNSQIPGVVNTNLAGAIIARGCDLSFGSELEATYIRLSAGSGIAYKA